MTSGDRIVLVLVLVAAIAAWPLAGFAAGSGAGRDVVIEAPGREVHVPLNVDRTIPVRGLRGTVTVRVEDGRVRVLDADCPDGLCVRQGTIGSPGGALICAPNGVSVWIGGGGGHGLDSIVR